MDQLQTRLDALESQVYTLTQHTHTMSRRLRRWRGLACGLAVAGLLGWGLPLGLAREDARDKDKDPKGLAQRVAALEKLLTYFTREKNEIFITGANLHIVNGLGQTGCGSEEEPIPDCPNGLGNLIVEYNEPRNDPNSPDVRTGSHNVVVGQEHNFSRFGGIVVGRFNTISGDFASVSGGGGNTASGESAAVSGGGVNTASGLQSAISGGTGNAASGDAASVSGGRRNTASGDGRASVSGGEGNTASGFAASVSGGESNMASAEHSSVSGGVFSTASGLGASVSGGFNITQETDNGWSAGSEADEVVEGNFRSP
jgi:hypothetical protein